MKIYLPLLLFIPLVALSQDYNKIRKSDTLYFYFKKTPYRQICLSQGSGFNDYKVSMSNYIEYKHIIFGNHWSIPEEKRIVKKKKSFLKKNKDIIIDYDYLVNTFRYESAKELFSSKKVVYLIDEKDIGWFTIKLRRFKAGGYPPPDIE